MASRVNAFRVASRAMSAGASIAESQAHMKTWKTYSKAGAAAVVAVGAVVMLKHFGGGHGHLPEVKYEYIEIRKRNFPWGKTSLFSSRVKCAEPAHH
eukprot:a676714_1647.p2 GENE.a676714_1647~~a676714_1647.p2  ORF type:complete len:108 (-),score=41.70 a676714_1647:40-330(-)